MSNPRVSVIVPVHNSEEYLAECLDSILGQTERDIEVICVDDGSTDSSPEILASHARRDGRVRVLTQECGGAGAARNNGLSVARGTYLSFLDSDDFFEPEMLESAADRLDETGADVVVFGSWLYDTNLKIKRDAYWTLVKANLPDRPLFSADEISDTIFNSFGNYTWNKLFRRSFVEDNDLRFQEISRTNDLLFVCAALVLARSITTIDEKYLSYRVATKTSLQSTNDRDPLSFFTAFCALQDWLKQRGCYAQFEYSFLKHALDAVVSNVDSLHSLESFERLQDEVRNRIEPRFEIIKQSNTLVFDPTLLGIYKNILNLTASEYFFFRAMQLRQDREMLFWRTSQLEAEIRIRQAAIESIQNSTSLKIGRAATYPGRLLKRLIAH